MNKAVLISIRPKWCELIASGQKTVEVRKSRPKLETPFKCYIYCTKPSFPHEDFLVFDAGTNKIKAFYGGGKVIGEFVCHNITRFDVPFPAYWDQVDKTTLDAACLKYGEAHNYLGHKTGWAWHISDLVIYDKPKELTEFTKPCPEGHNCATCSWYFPGIQDYGRCEPPSCGFWESDDSLIVRPPQSWCYVEELQ